MTEQVETPTQTEGQPTQAAPEPDVPQGGTTAETEPTEPPDQDRGKEGAEETEQRLELPEGWEQDEAVTTLRSESHAEGYRTAQSELTTTHDRTLKQMRADNADEVKRAAETGAASRVADAVVQTATAISKALKDSGDTAGASAALTDLLGSNPQWASLLRRDITDAALKDGETNAIARWSGLLGSELPKADRETLEAFIGDVTLEIRAGDTKLDAGFGRVVAKMIEIVRGDEAAKLEKLATSRQEQESRATGRDGKKAAPNVGGRGGGPQRSDRELKIDPTTPVSKLEEIRARELRG